MRAAACFFLAAFFLLVLLLSPLSLAVEGGDAFSFTSGLCKNHAHLAARVGIPKAFLSPMQAIGGVVIDAIPPFLKEPVCVPLRALKRLRAIFVEALLSEVSECKAIAVLS